MATTFGENVNVNGTLWARVMALPSGSVGNAQIAAAAGIDATKMIHQHAIHYAQAGGTNVVAAMVPIHTFRNTAEIVAIDVTPIVAPAGGDLAYTVDVQLGNASSAFASILSAVVTVDSASDDRTAQAATITTDDAVAGDTLQVVVTASGSTGSQGQGVLVTVWVREEP